MNEPLAITTLLILGITAVVSFRAFSSPGMIDALIFDPDRILRHREYRRIFTSALIHADWTHLLFNMFSLYSFGRAIELVFGWNILLTIYLSSILGGGLLSLYLHRKHEYRALGASGGVCGVIFASIFLLPGGSVYLFFIPFPIPSWVYALLFIVVSFVGMRTSFGNIGHDAHLGGALTGLAVTTFYRPTIVEESRLLYLAVVGITAALMIYAAWHPGGLQDLKPFSRESWNRIRMKPRGDRRVDAVDAELDQLLAKVGRQGKDSLTDEERQRLMELAERKRRKD